MTDEPNPEQYEDDKDDEDPEEEEVRYPTGPRDTPQAE
jgi:hypothetical protein